MILSLLQVASSRLLLSMPLEDLRERLIICCRLFCLHPSTDLALILRSASIFQGNTPFIMLTRKGWKYYK
jgi:hypothetical protein